MPADVASMMDLHDSTMRRLEQGRYKHSLVMFLQPEVRRNRLLPADAASLMALQNSKTSVKTKLVTGINRRRLCCLMYMCASNRPMPADVTSMMHLQDVITWH